LELIVEGGKRPTSGHQPFTINEPQLQSPERDRVRGKRGKKRKLELARRISVHLDTAPEASGRFVWVSAIYLGGVV
jgi:hypothetical protein